MCYSSHSAEIGRLGTEISLYSNGFHSSPVFLQGRFVDPLPPQLLVKEVQVQLLTLVLRVPDGVRVVGAPREHGSHPIPDDATERVGEGFIHAYDIGLIISKLV